jgi:hypothetical protein
MDACIPERAVRTRVSAPPARRQHGQSIVFVLGLAAALAGALVLSYGAGERSHSKRRLIDAADAAAFGGAVWQARTLNFQAYANRAIVANEVALAQAVSLRSWSAYFGRTLVNVDTVTQYVPYLGAATHAAAGVWSAVDAAIQPSMRGAEGISIAVNTMLANAQPAVHAFGLVAAEEVARASLAAAGPATGPSGAMPALLARNAIEWNRLTASYAGPERARLRTLVLDGRDGFTTERNARLAPPIVGLLARLEKRGGTELVGFDTWRGMDTLAVHRRRSLLFGSFREAIPVGWGAAQDAVRPSPLRGYHGGTWQTNPRTSQLAEATLPAQTLYAYPGIPVIRDVTNPSVRDERTVRFVVEAADRTHDPVADTRGLGVADLATLQQRTSWAPTPSANAVHALGAAVVRFERPEGRADGRREYANLYNPYWQARLAAPLASERALAAAARGGSDPYAALAP